MHLRNERQDEIAAALHVNKIKCHGQSDGSMTLSSSQMPCESNGQAKL
jgi:hypothetical protein